MKDFLGIVLPVIVLVGVALYCALPHPTHDRDRLHAAAAASAQLLAARPAAAASEPLYLPRDRWPTAIAALRPASVVVRNRMVDITIKPFFDGGWGYGYARDDRDLTMLRECWSALGKGMYWHGPC